MLTTRWQSERGDDWRRRHRLEAKALQNAWADWLGRVDWQLFITLTFDPKRVFPVDEDRASREAFWWCNQSSHIYRRPLGWVYAPERDRSGQWHVHVLMIGVPMIDGKASMIPEAVGMWKARNGKVDVQSVYDIGGITLYETKQAAQTGDLVWSDTIGTFRNALTAAPTVTLCPEDAERD